MRVTACSIREAKLGVRRWHRHNRPPVSGLFALALMDGDTLRGVAIVGRPVARALQDGNTCEVTRVATDGARNGCSMLYGAACREARRRGYRRIYTYTLAIESGASLRASGWTVDAHLAPRRSWSTKGRPRYDADLFGAAARPTGAKIRWRKALAPPTSPRACGPRGASLYGPLAMLGLETLTVAGDDPVRLESTDTGLKVGFTHLQIE